MITINLLPQKVRKSKGELQLYTYFVLGGSALALLLVLGLLNLWIQIAGTENRLKKVNQDLEASSALVAKILQGHEQERAIQGLESLVRPLAQNQPVWIWILDEMAGCIQDDLWLTSLLSRREKPGAPLWLAVEGEAYNKLMVADFLSALEGSKRFRQVGLDAIKETTAPGGAAVEFKLHLQVDETGGGG